MVFEFLIRIAAGWDCHDTNFYFVEKLPRMKPSINDVQTSMSNAEFDAFTNKVCVLMLSK